MSRTDPAVDAYIEKAPDFARPILEKIRKIFHRADPRIEETVRWSAPHFDHKGMLGGMAAFKKHVSFGFWKAPLMRDPKKLFVGGGAQSSFAIKVEKLSDLPPERVLVAYVKEAVELNEKGVKTPKKKAPPKKAPRVPADLAAALKKNARARAAFEGFSPSHRREYVEWIEEAKRDETRAKRLKTTLEWLAEGKPRNWKYMKKRP